jgi:hypothetical protein
MWRDPVPVGLTRPANDHQQVERSSRIVALRRRAAQAMTLVLVATSVVALGPGVASALPSFPGGYRYPTDSTAISVGFASGSGCPSPGNYISGYKHLGADFPRPVGAAVHAVGAGSVVRVSTGGWGSGNVALGIQHRNSDGSTFVALYGHIRTSLGVGARVSAGQQIGTVGSYSEGSHVHLGVAPGGLPSSGLGMLPCSTSGTNGFVDPIAYLRDRRPEGSTPPGSNPFGHFDLLTAPAPAKVRVRGWAADADAKTQSIAVHVYVGGKSGSGAEGHAITANLSRSDVSSAYPGYGDKHGFDATFTTSRRGSTEVCTYAINVGGGANALIGCKTVTIASPDPFGNVDILTSASPGTVKVAGWSADPDQPTTPTRVHVYIGGRSGAAGAEGHAFTADRSRPDVGTRHPGYGDQHGFSVTLTTAKRGSQQVCTYAINLGELGSNVLLGCGTVDIATPIQVFSDVPPTAYYAADAAWLKERGITTGWAGDPNTFAPDVVVTRAQMATFLWRMSGSPAATGTGFADVPAGTYYATAVAWLKTRGVLTGYAGDPNRFAPDEAVTRAQMATFLWRLAGQPAATNGGFTDVPAGTSYATAANWLKATGITTGYAGNTTTFAPTIPVTRAQMAAFLHRYDTAA